MGIYNSGSCRCGCEGILASILVTVSVFILALGFILGAVFSNFALSYLSAFVVFAVLAFLLLLILLIIRAYRGCRCE